jgi:hypothetical protein
VLRSVSTSPEFRAALSAANPGDIIDIADGASFGDSEPYFLISRSGTAVAPITIQGGPGVRLGTTVRVQASFIRLRNLEIDGTNATSGQGIYGPSGTDNEVCGVEVHDVHTTVNGPNPQGIITGSSAARWHFINVISRNNGRVPDNVADHGMYLSGSGFWLINVLLADNAAFGVQFYSNCTNCTAVHLTSRGNRLKSGLISAGSSTGNRVFNSVAYNNGSYGFERTSGTLSGDHLLAFGNPNGAYRSLSPWGLCITGTLADAVGHSNPAYSPPFDLNGNPRDSAPDAGAFENP